MANIPGLRLIQVNTDGLTVRVPRENKVRLEQVAEAWQHGTGLTLEETVYKAMMIRDVNNYLAVKEDGSVKRKGAYEYAMGWHQNHSALIIPKVAEKVLVEGVPIRQTVETWPDKMDFMLRTKVPRSSHLAVEYPGQEPIKIQNVTRYYVAQGGGHLFKWMPPLKTKPDQWRKIAVESGWGVCVCNKIEDATLPINYDYYIKEVEALCLGLK
jgi:hypothetical protein